MKEVKRIVSQIDAKRKTIERLQADLDATRDAATKADKHKPKLDELKLERRDILARAMINKKPANTATIDSQIANLEEQHAAAQTSAATAADAIDIISAGIAIEEGELDTLHDQLQAAISSEIIVAHDAGQEKYLAAIAAMEDGVAAMAAAERAWEHAAPVIGRRAFPAYGKKALAGVQSDGLRVPYTASRLVDPKVAAEFADGYEKCWFMPAWADPETRGFADKQLAGLIRDLQQAGVECRDFAPYQAPVPENQVKVRIIRGSIEASPIIVRDPATGSVQSKTPVVFAVGNDVMLDESQARQLQKVRMVLIHGEDEMPAPLPEDESPRRLEVMKPRDQVRVGKDLDIVGSMRDRLDAQTQSVWS